MKKTMFYLRKKRMAQFQGCEYCIIQDCEYCIIYESCICNDNVTCKSMYLKWLQEEVDDFGSCADCMYSISDGDLGFICCNGKSEQYGQYGRWRCYKYKEDKR